MRQPDDGSWEEEYIFNQDKEITALKVQLNMSEDLRVSDWRWGIFWNGVLTCVIIGFVFWTATHICQS